MKKLKDLKNGDLFMLPNGKQVYVKGGYNRFTKKYYYSKYYDINAVFEKKGDYMVIVDFEF